MISMHSTSRYTLLEEDISDDKIDDHNAIFFCGCPKYAKLIL